MFKKLFYKKTIYLCILLLQILLSPKFINADSDPVFLQRDSKGNVMIRDSGTQDIRPMTQLEIRIIESVQNDPNLLNRPFGIVGAFVIEPNTNELLEVYDTTYDSYIARHPYSGHFYSIPLLEGRTIFQNDLPDEIFVDLMTSRQNLDRDMRGGFTTTSDPAVSDPGGLIPCEGFNCGFEHLILAIQRIISWLLGISITFVAVIFAYAGWIYITSGGDSSKISKAHGMFTKAGIGFIIALSAFLLVRLILEVLGANLPVDLVDSIN